MTPAPCRPTTTPHRQRPAGHHPAGHFHAAHIGTANAAFVGIFSAGQHPLTRENYHAWQYAMPSALRHEILAHATAGIDEPLSWSPPADCAAGLHLPGREPDDIDLERLQHLIGVRGVKTTAAARELNVSIQHVRYAQQRLHRSAPDYPANSAIAARKLRARAAALLTREFFEREHHDAGKDIAAISTDTGFPRSLLAECTKRTGFKFTRGTTRQRIKVPRARKGDRIDRDWLQEQAGTLFHTNDDIAAELGLRGETVRRYRREYGIRSHTTGSAGHVVTHLQHPSLPLDIRRAVEGKRGGWQRLHRYQQMMTYPSMNSAAQAMDLHMQNLHLQIQRLEADISAPILQRAPHRYAPMQPTPRGQRLLDHLAQPDVAALLDRFANANARPKCGPYKRSSRQ